MAFRSVSRAARVTAALTLCLGAALTGGAGAAPPVESPDASPAQASGGAGAGPAYVFRARYDALLPAPPPARAPRPAPSPAEPAPRDWHATTLRASLDPTTHVVTGDEEIVWTNHSARAAGELWWHLYLNAFRDQRTLFLREALGPGRGGRPPDDAGQIDLERMEATELDGEGRPVGEAAELWAAAVKHTPGDPDDATDVRVALPRPLPPGGRLLLRVRFRAKLPSIVERTGYRGTFHMVAQWFPKLSQRTLAGEWNHFPFHRLSEFAADFGSYDATLDVPEGFLIGATGRLVEERREGGRRIARYVQDRVHDFAWVAGSELVERREQLGGVDLRLLFPPGHEPAIERSFEALGAAFDCFGRRYGPYPYDVLTLVHPPPGADEAGGMEYPTLITTGGPWSGPPWARPTEAVTMHEFGHQYFYGTVASDEHASPFLDEGLTSYAEGVCLDERYGAGSYVATPWFELESAASMRLAALRDGVDVPIARPAPGFPTARHYNAAVYDRSALLLRTLAGAFGAGVVDDALARYVRSQRFRHPGPDDLLDAFGEAGGPDLREALRVGLFERGRIDVAVRELGSRPAERGGASGVQSRAVIVRRGELVLPVRVRFFFDDGSVEDRSWAGQGAWVSWDIDGPSALRAVVVDPDGALWLDENWANNARSIAPQASAPRVWERAAYWFGLLALALAP